MAVAQDDILRCVWKYRVTGVATRGINTYYLKVSDFASSNDVDITAEIDGYITSLYDFIVAQLSLDYVAESVRVTNVSKKEFVGDLVPTFAGTALAGTSMPAQVATELLGRARKLGHIARKYIGPCTEAAYDDGVLTAAALAQFNLMLDEYVQGFVGAVTLNTYLPVMVTFAVGGGVAAHEVIDEDLGLVVQTARTQRSRTPGRGLT